MLIARATDEEREWCARLMAASEPWITLGRGLELCRARCARPGDELWVGHDQAGAPLGFILMSPRGVAGSPYVASIAVAAEARGRGLGAALMRFAEERWRGSAKHLFLCVSSFNEGARRLYERLGYRRVGEFEDYVIDGASEILMHKRLDRQ